mmetsp:Transcript_83426/g.137980  ORF Transcript_83426/g.137980 Transcript_83426/m.137980 type:complete len:203 (-) Transcript_83426:403-1011(-)
MFATNRALQPAHLAQKGQDIYPVALWACGHKCSNKGRVRRHAPAIVLALLLAVIQDMVNPDCPSHSEDSWGSQCTRSKFETFSLDGLHGVATYLHVEVSSPDDGVKVVDRISNLLHFSSQLPTLQSCADDRVRIQMRCGYHNFCSAPVRHGGIHKASLGSEAMLWKLLFPSWQIYINVLGRILVDRGPLREHANPIFAWLEV